LLSLSLGDDAEMRALEPWNAAELLEFADKHREFLAPWAPWTETATNMDDTTGWLERFAKRHAADTGRLYGIWVAGKLVGGAMWRILDASTGVGELGVWLSPGVLGRGLITRACERMIEWAVDQRGLERVEWVCDVNNGPSRAVAQRLGMTHEGTFRKADPMHGRRVDMQLWAVLADEWQARKTA
jgi:ribosomal-protein-serine acetyltransferase